MLALATVGMLLIALVSIGGFTVLAQRRMRSLGMLESMGATDRNVRLVLEANGVIVGRRGRRRWASRWAWWLWLAYRPHNEQSAHHVIGDVRAAVERDRAGHGARGASRPSSPPATRPVPSPACRSSARSPDAPRRRARSTARFVPGVIALVIGFVMFSALGCGGERRRRDLAVPGLIALIVGIILVSPFFLALLARVGRQVADRHPPARCATWRATGPAPAPPCRPSASAS